MRNLRIASLISALCISPIAIGGAGPDDLGYEDEQTNKRVSEPVLAGAADSEPKPAPSIVRSQRANVQKVSAKRSMTIYASDKTAEVKYEKTGPVLGLNNSRANVGFLFNEERDNALTGAIMYDVKPEFMKGLRASLGTKVYAGLLSIENADVFALAAGIELAYQFPIRQFPLVLQASLNYAPDILTFGQSDRIIDWSASAGLDLTDNIFAFAGVRYLQFDTRPGDRELDNQAHIGVRWNLNAK